MFFLLSQILAKSMPLTKASRVPSTTKLKLTTAHVSATVSLRSVTNVSSMVKRLSRRFKRRILNVKTIRIHQTFKQSYSPQGMSKQISFRHTIKSEFKPHEIWYYISNAFVDSRMSPIWPDDLETVSSHGFGIDATINVNYHINILGIHFTDHKLQYKITDFVDGKAFTYEPMQPHPFKGYGRVEIQPTQTGSLLEWKGDYTYDGFSIAALWFPYFERRFFRDLESNLHREEQAHKSSRQFLNK